MATIEQMKRKNKRGFFPPYEALLKEHILRKRDDEERESEDKFFATFWAFIFFAFAIASFECIFVFANVGYADAAFAVAGTNEVGQALLLLWMDAALMIVRLYILWAFFFRVMTIWNDELMEACTKVAYYLRALGKASRDHTRAERENEYGGSL